MLDTRRPVQWAKISKIETPTIGPDAFTYRPDRGWRWLQRIAFKVLGWIGAYQVSVVTTFTRTPQENDDLLKSLFGQEGELIELLHHSRDRLRIYMGPDEHTDLLRLANHLDMSPFTLNGRIETCDNRHGGKWHDIPITVVPWMVGAAIVPA